MSRRHRKNAHAVAGAGRCPRCGSRSVKRVSKVGTGFYADILEACQNPACDAVWEPIDTKLLLDARLPKTSSFTEPCDNCAFRHGSFEQSDPERWRKLMADLKGDPDDPYGALTAGGFYCHKGVPIDPAGEHGFAYPTKIVEIEGQAIEIQDRAKLRPCRGWLRMAFARADAAR